MAPLEQADPSQASSTMLYGTTAFKQLSKLKVESQAAAIVSLVDLGTSGATASRERTDKLKRFAK